MKEVNSLQQMHRDGRINRRDFLKVMGALGFSAMAANELLTASTVLAGTPVKGGTAIFANNIHGPDDQMDPIVFTSGIDYTRGIVTYNGLIQILDDMSLHPELAEEWSANSNATEFTFKIRKGVRFHDGSKFSADDVVWSMNRHLGKDSASVAKSFFANITEWKKVDQYTVKAMLSSPDSDLPIKLGEKQCKIVKKDTVDFTKGNGTGPFRLVSFEPGVKSLHTRNEDYWREGANLDGIEVTAITDPTARVNALIAGNVHLIVTIDAKAVKL
ncbi:MAG: ABC transporter substrate-binding protein, partial [SAR324 cluster bacterium]|nr:ABC transporter substrate-binding protein [SAR324 cluster bacterium]